MRFLFVSLLILAGCVAPPATNPKPAPVTSQVMVAMMPPMPLASMGTFSVGVPLSVEITAPAPTSDTTAANYGKVVKSEDGAFLQWNNWPTNSDYRIEVSTDLKTWRPFATGNSGGSNSIRIIDNQSTPPTYFYRMVKP